LDWANTQVRPYIGWCNGLKHGIGKQIYRYSMPRDDCNAQSHSLYCFEHVGADLRVCPNHEHAEGVKPKYWANTQDWANMLDWANTQVRPYIGWCNGLKHGIGKQIYRYSMPRDDCNAQSHSLYC